MSYPKNPETIILKNRFYTKGLTEGKIYNYYIRNKQKILEETKDRFVAFVIITDKDRNPILRRKGKKSNYIRLTSLNYDTIITGRTIAIYSEMKQNDNILIIDIDTDNFRQAKVAAVDVYSFVLDNLQFIRRASIVYTGKESFHIRCQLARQYNINAIKHLLKKELEKSDLSRRYTIEARRRPGIPNLDLSPNKNRGLWITKHSLSIWGLKCMELPFRGILNFYQEKARIL